MSTITSISASTDSPSSGVGIINTNFTNLNTDKVEAADSRTLTNKTINATNNTISNITTAMLATAAKTGILTKAVTGTAGTTGALAKWDANGDLVTTSLTATTSVSSASTDSTIPTSKAVYTALATVTANTKMFIPWSYTNGTVSQISGYQITSLDSGQIAGCNFVLPYNASGFTSLEIIMIPDTTETITWTEQLTYAAIGGTAATITATDSARTVAVTTGLMSSVTGATGTNIAAITGAITKNQYCSFTITSGTTLLRVLGFRITYTV